MPTRIVLVAIVLVAASSVAAADGLTVVTHGFQGNMDWVEDAGDKLVARIGGGKKVPLYILKFEDDEFELTLENGLPFDSSSNTLRHAVILFDWTAYDGGSLTPTGYVAYRLVKWLLLDSQTDHGELMLRMLNTPIHLIGHSRGSSLVGATAEILGSMGFWVDQITFLDPHPTTNGPTVEDDWGEDGMAVPGNVVFADCYYRTGSGGPDGETVAGAHNVELDNSFFGGSGVGYGGVVSDQHSDVHAWYRGTIPAAMVNGEIPTEDDDVTITSSWYSASAYEDSVARARTSLGYVYSYAVGQGTGRPSTGLRKGFDGGGQTRSFSQDLTNKLDIVGYLTLQSTSVAAANSVKVDFYYEFWTSAYGVQFWLDTNRNPYDGKGYHLHTQYLSATTGVAKMSNLSLTVNSGQPSGDYQLLMVTTNPSGMRCCYAPRTIHVTDAPEPDLQITITLTDSYLGGGESFRMYATVRNTGEAAALSPSVTMTAPSGYTFTDEPSTQSLGSSLAAGASKSVQWDLEAPVANTTATFEVGTNATANGKPYVGPTVTLGQTVAIAAPTGSVRIDTPSWYTNTRVVPLVISASAASWTSVDQMSFRNETGSWSSWESYRTWKTWTLSDGDGSKRVWVRFRDALGTVSAEASDTIDLDTTDPVGQLVLNRGGDYSNTRSVHVGWSATDAGSGVTWYSTSYDGVNWSDWAFYVAVDEVLPGEDLFPSSRFPGDRLLGYHVRFKDFAGNLSDVYGDSFLLDTTPPAGAVVINADDELTNRLDATLLLPSSDALSGVADYHVRNEGGEWTAWTGIAGSAAWTLPVGDGTKRVEVQYRDRALNVSDVAADDIVLDRTPPVGSLLLNGGWPATNRPVLLVELTGTDNLSGVDLFQIGIAPGDYLWSWTPFLSSLPFTWVREDGPATLYGRLKDRAGNVSAEFSDDIIFDWTPPSGSFRIVDPRPYYLADEAITLDVPASDFEPGSGVRDFAVEFTGAGPGWTSRPYSLSGGSKAVLDRPLPGLLSASVRVRDWAGNTGFVAAEGGSSLYVMATDLPRVWPRLKLAGRLDTPSDIDAYELDLVSGDRLSVKAQGVGDGKGMALALDLVDPDGARVVVRRWPADARKTGVKKLEVPATGRYTLVVRPDAPSAGPGDYRIALTVKQARENRRVKAESPDGRASFVAAQPGSVRISVKGDGVAPETVRLVGPEGDCEISVKGRKGLAKIKADLNAGTGSYEVIAGTGATAKFVVRIKAGARASEDRTDELDPESLFGVEATAPADGDVVTPGLVETGGRLAVAFNAPVAVGAVLDPGNAYNGLTSSVNLLDSVFQRVAGTPELDAETGRALTFAPAGVLPAGQYTLTVGRDVTDEAGRPLSGGRADHRMSFTVGPDVYAPVIRSTWPVPNQRDVPPEAAVRVTFNEQIAPDSVAGHVVRAYADGIEVPVESSVVDDGFVVRLRPPGGFPPRTEIRVTIPGGEWGVKDPSGNPFLGVPPDAEPYTFEFVTGEYAGFGASTTSFDGREDVALNEVLEIDFDLPLNPATVNFDTVRIREVNRPGVAPSGRFTVDGSRLLFHPMIPTRPDLSDAGLLAGTAYRVTFGSGPNVLKSESGDPLVEPREFGFATRSAAPRFVDNFADPAPPSVVDTEPVAGMTGVATDARFVLTFRRRPLHPETVTTAAVRLRLVEQSGEPRGEAVPISLWLSQTEESVQVTITPLATLEGGGVYEVSVSGLKDLVGMECVPFVARFLTRGD